MTTAEVEGKAACVQGAHATFFVLFVISNGQIVTGSETRQGGEKSPPCRVVHGFYATWRGFPSSSRFACFYVMWRGFPPRHVSLFQRDMEGIHPPRRVFFSFQRDMEGISPPRRVEMIRRRDEEGISPPRVSFSLQRDVEGRSPPRLCEYLNNILK